jgi:hypothetical protein
MASYQGYEGNLRMSVDLALMTETLALTQSEARNRNHVNRKGKENAGRNRPCWIY